MMIDNNRKYIIGCSGFHYDDWKGNFYPPDLAKSKWFEFYNGHFDTVELNVTFYRTMKNSFFENLYNRSKNNFLFSVKVSRVITHYKKFIDTKQILVDFYNNVRSGLKDKLGCVLFQLPPNLTYKPETLERIVQQLDPSFNNIIEFRHESWWRKDVYSTLERNHICFCTVSYPGIPDQLIINGPLVYVRLHGVPNLYRSPYKKEFLKQLAESIKKSKKIKQAFIYFDNTDGKNAILNAQQLQQLLPNIRI